MTDSASAAFSRAAPPSEGSAGQGRPNASGSESGSEPGWAQRFRAAGVSFPQCARDVPERTLYTSNAAGSHQLYCWDRARDRHVRLTRHGRGVWQAAITPDGAWVWWFRDHEGDEHGHWLRQPYGVPATEDEDPAELVPGLEPGFPTGLALGRDLAVVGLMTSEGTRVFLHRAGERQEIYAHAEYATVNALSHDDRLLAIGHSEHGDAFHPAVRVLRLPEGAGDTAGGTGESAGPETVGELRDPGSGLQVFGFAPRNGDSRLLLGHERRGHGELLLWDPVAEPDGPGTELELDLEGALSATWYPDGRSLLVKRHHHGRDRLYRYHLDTARLDPLSTPHGVIGGYAVRPNGDVEYLISSGERPHAVLGEGGRPVLESPDPAAPSVPLTDAWVEGPGGPIHALIARPESNGPAATVFLLHGGPGGQVADGFWAARAAFVDSGYCVVHVNYRGSSGYGSAWREADREQPGLIELEDVAAAREWAVAEGIADPDRCVISGISWGGYLTLLGLGVQPELWAAGIGCVPIGDMVALYEDEMEAVRQHDRALFGGSPEELPEKWARSSPVTYASAVRAPLLVIASTNDPRCPFRSVRNFLDRLDEHQTPYETYLFEEGHFSLVADEQIRQMTLQLDFLARHVPA